LPLPQCPRPAAACPLLLDCQADVLGQLTTRFVVPLVPATEAPRPIARLNPQFSIGGVSHVMLTQVAAAVAAAEPGETLCSLADQEYVVGTALDMLLSGV